MNKVKLSQIEKIKTFLNEYYFGYGVYFPIVRITGGPMILTQKAWFKNFNVDYEIEPEKSIIKSDKSKSELDYSDLRSVQKRKTYFALKTDSKQRI